MNSGKELHSLKIIVDSNYIGHVSRYSTGGLTHNDSPVGVIFGFLNQILNIGNHFQTNEFYFAWDSKHSYRRQICPEYKKHRKKTLTSEEKEELKQSFQQFDRLRRDILPSIGFKNQLSQRGCEADDIIAMFVKQADLSDILDEGVTIISADEDLYQLLQRKVSMYTPAKKSLMTDMGFKAFYGIEPKDWVKVKALAGCSSDNVKGIAGVGEKTAIKYLVGELKEGKKLRDILEQQEEMYFKNYPLVKLPIKETKKLKITDNELGAKAELEFDRVCTDLGFNSFIETNKLSRWEEFFRGDFNPFMEFN